MCICKLVVYAKGTQVVDTPHKQWEVCMLLLWFELQLRVPLAKSIQELYFTTRNTYIIHIVKEEI